MKNILQFTIRSNANPKILVYLDDLLLQERRLQEGTENLYIEISEDQRDHIISISKKSIDSKDEPIEIVQASIDGAAIPDHLLRLCCDFEYHSGRIEGSTYLIPDGIWRFRFSSPILIFLLDLKIAEEARYSEDYKYPWSYQLGPETVTRLITDIDEVIEKVNKVL